LVIAGVRMARGYFAARGARVIACPETQHPEVVSVDRGEAALSALLGQPSMRLDECSRWPERSGCDQACLSQIEESPTGCLVATAIKGWYAGQRCVFCAQPFHEIHWHDHKPGFRGPEGNLLEWPDVEATKVFDIMESHKPVCWSCLMTEGFRKQFPERVIDAPSDSGARRAR
jgi:hypothetical protein